MIGNPEAREPFSVVMIGGDWESGPAGAFWIRTVLRRAAGARPLQQEPGADRADRQEVVLLHSHHAL